MQSKANFSDDFCAQSGKPNKSATFNSSLTSSADNLCKQFRPRSSLTECRSWSGSKQFDTLKVFLKEFFEEVNFEKTQQTTTRACQSPSMQRVKCQKSLLRIARIGGDYYSWSDSYQLPVNQLFTFWWIFPGKWSFSYDSFIKLHLLNMIHL